jgi:ectoine hydroxylase-related dioxygenase (phytanoyl-CoA dioxygenase family)
MGAAERSPGGKPMPGAVAIRLRPGQAVFWTGALLHRGNMRQDKERMTLECHWVRSPKLTVAFSQSSYILMTHRVVQACPPPVPPPRGPNGAPH